MLVLLILACFTLIFAVQFPFVWTASWAVERALCFFCCFFALTAPDFAEVKRARVLFALFLPLAGSIFLLVWTVKSKKYAQISTPPPSASGTGTLSALSLACKPFDGVAYAQTAEFLPVEKGLFPRLLNDLTGAKSFVYLEFYLIGRGFFRDSVLSVLEKKAKEGVKVYLLYDDLGCAFTLPHNYCKQLAQAGVTARTAQKIPLFPTATLNCRDHRKCVVIDGEIAYTGGVNLADEYVGRTVRFGHWKDSMLRVTGEGARAFARLFEEGWNCRFPKERLSHEYPTPPAKGEIPLLPFRVKPYEGQRSSYYRLIYTLLARAEARFFLTTPYLVPDEGLIFALQAAAGRGVDVRILIPHHPDKRTVFLLTRRFARLLNGYGVRVREYEAGFLHAKNLTVDGKYAVVSSCNLDLRSLRLQYECGALVESAECASAVERDFLSAWEQSVAVPDAGVGERALCALLTPLSPLL